MTTHTNFPVGAPCWADLWTSDVEGTRRFYSQLFGWEALEPDPNYGGYFIFARDGAWTAGCMGSMGDMKADDTWKPYLSTDDIEGTLKKMEAAGAQVASGAMAVGDLGVQAVVTDPTGAVVGLWQPGTWPGFGVIGEHAAPSWFELHSRDHAGAVAFYREVFGFEMNTVSDTDDFRYTTFRVPGSDTDLGGIADSSGWLPEGTAHWSIYWEVDDADAAVAAVQSLGGSLRQGPDITPWGTLAVVADPAGAELKLRSTNP
jgi:predicted enzyme related to lactoylglutathione lyase